MSTPKKSPFELLRERNQEIRLREGKAAAVNEEQAFIKNDAERRFNQVRASGGEETISREQVEQAARFQYLVNQQEEKRKGDSQSALQAAYEAEMARLSSRKK